MDYVFFNGNFITLDEKNPHIEALLVRDNKIFATGSLSLLKNLSVNPEFIDLKGNFLLPALTDAHTHFVETANHFLTLNVLECKTEDDLYKRLIDYRKNNLSIFTAESINWIKGYGWEKQFFDKHPNINRFLIDRVFPDIPVTLASKDLHSTLCNSKALEIANIKKNTPSINGVVVGKMLDDEPNGFIYEQAWTLLAKYIPHVSESLQNKLIKKLIDKSIKLGLCGVHSFEDLNSAKVINNLSKSIDFYFTWYYLNTDSDTVFKNLFLPETKHFRNAGIKLFADGSLGSDSAWMFENQNYSQETLNSLKKQLANAHSQNIQVAIHSIGDYAVFNIAKIIHDNNKISKDISIKHRLEHLQAVRPEDINLLKKANIHASMQSIHIKEDALKIRQTWNHAKEYAFPINSIIKKGIHLALGSDSPVETLNPFEGIKYATNRSILLPEEEISLIDALKAYTYKHHIIANKKIDYGIIKKGLFANLIILDKYVFSNPEIIPQETLMTMINGKIYHMK